MLRTGRKGLAAATLLGDALKGTVAVVIWSRHRSAAASSRSSPRSAPSSATCFRSGSASRAARASPPISASCSALAWPVGARVLPDLARGRGADPLLLARRARRQRATPFALWLLGDRPEAAAVRAADGAAVDHAPHQHRAADQRHRRQDRREAASCAGTTDASAERRRSFAVVVTPLPARCCARALRSVGPRGRQQQPTGVRLTDEQRLDWLRLIRSENVGPRTFRALRQSLRQRARRARRPARSGAPRRRGAARRASAPRDEAERELEAARRARRRLRRARRAGLSAPLLQMIDDAPPLLAVRGTARGARAADGRDRRLAQRLGRRHASSPSGWRASSARPAS